MIKYEFMTTRIAKVRKVLKDLKVDSLFITGQQNVTYLTNLSGFSQNEREGFFFVTSKSAYLLTFPTYYHMYKDKGKGFTTLCITQQKSISSNILEITKKEKVESIGFEENNLTIADLNSLKRNIKIKFKNTKGIIENLRITKEKDELVNIRQAAKVADLAFDFIFKKIKKGVSERDLALNLEFFIKKNAEDVSFPPIVAFGENSAIPHYLPSPNQKLTTNNLVLLDFGAKINGYCSDMTRVVFFESPPDSWVKIYNVVLQAQTRALKSLQVGIKCSQIDKIARDYISSQKLPPYQHGLGHGVGLAVHELPKVKPNNNEILKENSVITIEPGIYQPGNCGVRIEDLVVLKKDEIEVLTKSSKEITIIT